MHWGVALSVVSVACLVVSGPIYRIASPPFTLILLLFVVALALGALGALLGLVSLGMRVSAGGTSLIAPLVALVIGGGAAGLIGLQVASAGQYPMIHDITTDTEDPPQFLAALEARGPDANSLDYVGKRAEVPPGSSADPAAQPLVADLQQAHYPDIVPIRTSLSFEEAFTRSKSTAEDLGWTILRAETGVIEATQTSAWFGFTDDIVIRLTDEETEVRIDLRSVSRVGKSDLGANAKRIRAFAAALQG